MELICSPLSLLDKSLGDFGRQQKPLENRPLVKINSTKRSICAELMFNLAQRFINQQ
ncbi:hypothetical protein SynBIOSE41_01048 [Synechococcus sp. BIOS-E4-1]|nr:hypothetical protein SynBIOSE41_01048 [Synechococcus sp. BIOS-E4-1]